MPADDLSGGSHHAPRDERAFRALVEQHGPRLYSVALGILGDINDAESVVQDAFIRLAQSGHVIRNADALNGWLYRVTVNLCRDVLRRRRREFRQVPLEIVKDTLPSREQVSDDVPSPDDDEELWRSLDQLPQKLREVVVLRFASNMSYAELANVLDLSAGTVASRLHRALQRLGKQLGHLRRNAQ